MLGLLYNYRDRQGGVFMQGMLRKFGASVVVLGTFAVVADALVHGIVPPHSVVLAPADP